MRKASFFMVLALATASVGCSDDSSTSTAGCIDLCREGQAGSCTWITGDCTAFCRALDGVQGPSGCADERAAYQGCLNRAGDACSNACRGEEGALTSCVATYCAANPTNADCITIADST